MEPDCYKVEVLHYLNPHLIWVEVLDSKRDEEFVFEQIGIYGLLPYEATVDVSDDSIICQRCPEWVSAAVVVMKKALYDAKEVLFRPTYIDRRSSIFDDNIHKYGELIIIMFDGDKLELSKLLIDSGFAMENVCLFHQELSLGNLKTKLSNTQIHEVIKYLKKDNHKQNHKERESKVKKQTSVFEAAQSFESELTTQNLERFNRQLTATTLDKIVQKKMKDFDKCKDIDEESVGRANYPKQSPEESKMPSLLKKKLELVKSQKNKIIMKDHNHKSYNSKDPLQVLLATKHFLEANAKIKDDTDSNVSGKSVHKENDGVSQNISDNIKDDNDIQDSKGLEIAMKHDTNDFPISFSNVKSYDYNSIKKERAVEIKSSERHMKRGHAKKSTKSNKVLEYDVATEKRVAYGPPGLDVKHLSLKVVPKMKEMEDINLVSTDDRKEVKPKDNFRLFADVDSLVNFDIGNTNLLEAKLFAYTEDSKNSSKVCDDDTNTKEAITHKHTETSKPVQNQNTATSRYAVLQKKLKLHKEMTCKKSDSSATSHSDTTNKDSSTSFDDVKPTRERNQSATQNSDYLNSDDDVTEIVKKINEDYRVTSVTSKVDEPKDVIKTTIAYKNNVNPFKNVDDSISVFVDKLVSPVLMVHSKMDKRIEPCSNLRDVPFNNHIHVVLKNMSIERPMMLQMISWPVILRGFSLFMISPLGSGKTLGYLPAVCRLITDFNTDMVNSVGPTCIIVCATAQAVSEVEKLALMFLGVQEKVLSCYAGMDELHVTTSLLNGCDLFICTPSVLVRLLQLTEFGVDLRRLSTFVLDDCERLSEVYSNEIKFFLVKIKEMYKSRVNKEHKVQFVVASRVWCDFMEPLAKKAPNSVACIGAFQECVLYSKTNTTVNFVKKDNKITHLLDFLKEIDSSKKSVIVCRSDDEVDEIGRVLNKQKYITFVCNSTMTVEELYNLSKAWVEYQEPILGLTLICCDGNLTHLNVTDAHHLVHYSLPSLFSMFCKRFSVLNSSYSSIFNQEKGDAKIKIFFEDSNMEQLPKILNFIKRCTNNVPEFLGKISETILQEKDVIKGKSFVPICDSLLTLGECPDFWNCLERHGVFNEYDKPKDWMPTTGIVTFKVLHYHTAVRYSVRLLSNSIKGSVKKYPQTYNMLSLKMGMYFSKESNHKLHGIPKAGDVCAVSIKQNFFARCQVVKVLNYYNNGTPNTVLIKLIDEERLELARDIYLFYLPDELKSIVTHIVQVRLANIRPKDNDVTFSDLARNQLKAITDKDEDLYMRGQVVLTIGNCVFVDTLDACQELTSLNETVVRYNFKKELLDKHAVPNPNHTIKLNDLCKDFEYLEKEELILVESKTAKKQLHVKPQWAHLERDDLSQVFFSSAESPNTFFVRLTKFEPCMKILVKEIDKYVQGNPTPVAEVQKGDILLAKFPDDSTFERARVDDIIDRNTVKCFYVDQGDWGTVLIKDLLQLPEVLLAQMPFQAIECSLLGVKPAGEDWTEFGTNWFLDSCYEDESGGLKQLFVKYFTKSEAVHTGGHKYGVVLIDTTTVVDVLINQMMINLNLAQEKEDEIHYFNELDFNKTVDVDSRNTTNVESFVKDVSNNVSKTLVPVNTPNETNVSLDKIFLKKPIRSVPLVKSDSESDDDSGKWDIVNTQEIMSAIIPKKSQQVDPKTTNKKATVESEKSKQIVPKTTNTKATVESVPQSIKNNKPVAKSPLNTSKSESIPDTSKSLLKGKAAKTASARNHCKSPSTTLDSDDLSSTASSQLSEKMAELPKNFSKIEEMELRKPKLVWKQNKSSLTVKIQLIGADDYNLDITDRSMKFSTYLNDTNYGFDFEFYGVVDSKSSVHSDKGQYILVILTKVMKKNWLTLTRDGSIRKWIQYDLDSIDTSSDEEDERINPLADVAKNIHNRDRDSDSDEDLLDDINYEYKRDSD